jgi:CheY-like chemotaxis protein
MRLLVVEDEKKAGEYLKKGLEESGFTVDIATNGIDGLHHALEEDYALIVLDIMLPGMDGWELLKRLRAKRDTPVLFLTAMDELEERVRGLELGADDDLSSRSPSWNCWPASAPCSAAGRPGTWSTCISATWKSMPYGGAYGAPASVWTLRRANSRCCNCSPAGAAKC